MQAVLNFLFGGQKQPTEIVADPLKYLPAGGGMPPSAQNQEEQLNEPVMPSASRTPEASVRNGAIVVHQSPTKRVPPAIAYWGSTMDERLHERIHRTGRFLALDNSFNTRDEEGWYWTPSKSRTRIPDMTIRTEPKALSGRALEKALEKAKAAKRLQQRNLTREIRWDGSTRQYVPPTFRGIKPMTSEPWAKDNSIYENPFERINAGMSAATEQEALKEFNTLCKFGKPVDVQAKLLEDIMEYDKFVFRQRERRIKRRVEQRSLESYDYARDDQEDIVHNMLYLTA